MSDKDELNEMIDDWREESARIRKQVIDQTAHFMIGFIGVMMMLCFGVPSVLAVAFIMAGAMGRELSQHRTIYPWDLGKGSFLDLAFWLAGCTLAAMTVTVHI